MKWGCRKCGKPVKVKDGKLSCCGITETVKNAEAVERTNRGLVRQFLAANLRAPDYLEEDEYL